MTFAASRAARRGFPKALECRSIQFLGLVEQADDQRLRKAGLVAATSRRVGPVCNSASAGALPGALGCELFVRQKQCLPGLPRCGDGRVVRSTLAQVDVQRFLEARSSTVSCRPGLAAQRQKEIAVRRKPLRKYSRNMQRRETPHRLNPQLERCRPPVAAPGSSQALEHLRPDLGLAPDRRCSSSARASVNRPSFMPHRTIVFHQVGLRRADQRARCPDAFRRRGRDLMCDDRILRASDRSDTWNRSTMNSAVRCGLRLAPCRNLGAHFFEARVASTAPTASARIAAPPA